MRVLGYAQIERRSGGMARVWVHNIAEATDYNVVVDDSEPDDVFGPIFVRAAEQAGIEVDSGAQVYYEAPANFDGEDEVTLIEAL